MRVVFASAEVAPYARVGGLSDVVGALPKEIAALGHEPIVFLPLYASVDRKAHGVIPVEGLGALRVPMGEKTEEVALHTATMPGAPGVRVYFVGHEGAFGREGIYVDPATGHGYPDEVERFALLSRALLESLLALELAPDVIHLNDHHTAFAAAYLRELYRDTALARAGIVFSIHNLAYLGTFDSSRLPGIGFPEETCAPGSPFEYKGQVSALKLGIEYADFVNTVSERYAVEISSDPKFGHGLEGALAEKRGRGRLLGILNGVDYSVWDPSVDALIPSRYDAADLTGKTKCRNALVERAGLVESDGPIIGIVSRLADQKGFDLIREVADEIIALGARLVVLGTGQPEYHEFLAELSVRHEGLVSTTLAFDNKLAHWIEAGSDMFLMPSLYEPCGLNQMYSLRYGTVPVVRATGGLVDTVQDFDPATGTGVGFVFGPYESKAMLGAIERAVATYADSAIWRGIVQRGMALDFSWKASAVRYLELYERAASRPAKPTEVGLSA